jgi:hypothetical protein
VRRINISKAIWQMASAVLLIGLIATQAKAQLTLTFNPTTFPSALPGQTLTIQAVLTNLTPETVSLDVGTSGGSIIGPGSPGMTWNDTNFITNLPDFLDVGASYSANFDINIEPTAPAGLYTATYNVSGTGQSTATTYDASAFALITLIEGGSSIPEPCTLALLVMGSSLVFISKMRTQKRGN